MSESDQVIIEAVERITKEVAALCEAIASISKDCTDEERLQIAHDFLSADPARQEKLSRLARWLDIATSDYTIPELSDEELEALRWEEAAEAAADPEMQAAARRITEEYFSSKQDPFAQELTDVLEEEARRRQACDQDHQPDPADEE